MFNLGPNNDLLDRVPDAVLGQGSLYAGAAATTQSQFNSPRGLTFDPVGNRLFVADYTNNRVMVFDVAAITNGENAVNVLGQATFTTSNAATTQTGLGEGRSAGQKREPLGSLPAGKRRARREA